MDRDEALKLLKSVPEGIQEWNTWRKTGEQIPSLKQADLRGADLRGADLGGARLSMADLGLANLSGAKLSRADLRLANLSGAKLSRADLVRAKLVGAQLIKAVLIEANLVGAQLIKAVLIEANLSGANLSSARLFEADLSRADLSKADLSGADLSGASLLRANLSGAKLRDCRIFGISAWEIQTDEDTEQVSLIISDDDDPIMTVDNLKVAQFIYLLLNNEEIRNVIDAITSKVVLILGRFTPERKAVLDAIRDELRRHNYLPVMFDFEKPASRGYTDTVTTLARMARFVVADLTDAAEVRLELAKIVPDLPSVPVQPLILVSQAEYATFVDIRRYPWVLEPFRYRDPDHAIASLPEMVLAPAEAKVTEVRA